MADKTPSRHCEGVKRPKQSIKQKARELIQAIKEKGRTCRL